MAKQLTDGEKRKMQPAKWLEKSRKDVIKVFALREDSETHYVILQIENPTSGIPIELWLDDVLAEDIKNRIDKALSLLPHSK